MDDLFCDKGQDDSLRDQVLARAEVEALTGPAARHLVDCDLEEADLSGLDLAHWTFTRCNLRRTDFSKAALEGTAWQSCRGAFANFTASDLGEARFISCDFNNASFRRAALGLASFLRCKLTGADLTDAKTMELKLEETLLINAKLPGHSFHKMVLKQIDFSQADLRKCDFRMADFEACSLRDASMDGSRFDGADLRGADLGGLRLVDASLFRGATISREQASQLLSELGINVR